MAAENHTKGIADAFQKANISEKLKTKDVYLSTITNDTNNTPKDTIPNCLMRTVSKNPKYPVLKYKSNPKGDFDMTITMDEYLNQIRKAARSFIKVGLETKASVGILGFNHPVWFISEIGAIFAGAFASGIYTTNTANICKFIMNDCNCQVVVLENDSQLSKILSVQHELPKLKAIIKYTGAVTDECRSSCKIPIYSWDEFLALDTSNEEKELEKRLEAIKPDDCAILIYTSGTTGCPKGVMLSHDNIIFMSTRVLSQLEIHPFKHSIISYLPMSHVAANIIDIVTTVTIGATIYFAEPDAFKGSLGKTLKEVRPTIFISVPRVFEKIAEQMRDYQANKNGNNHSDSATSSTQNSSKAKTDKVDNSKVKKALGFDRCEYIASAAAPLAEQTLEFFLDMGIEINQIYGMSECGPMTLELNDKRMMGSVGVLLKGVEIKIHDPDKNSVGEICTRGRHVFLGYYNALDKTKEALDSDGWLHSGDLGKIENEEFLFVTGRIKELLITAGGENVAPVPIEDKIKEELPFISNAVLVGDKQKFISCLLTLKLKVDSDTQLLTDELTSTAIRSFNDIGLNLLKVDDVLKCTDPILKKTIDDAINKVNASSVSRAAYVQKWVFLPSDFSINGEELGPTLKLKRPVIAEKYSKYITSLYS